MNDKPRWRHNCKRCRFLGQCIGGMRFHDLYVCDNPDRPSPVNITLIARFGDDGPDYLSAHPAYVRPEGHAELFAAKNIWKEETNQ